MTVRRTGGKEGGLQVSQWHHGKGHEESRQDDGAMPTLEELLLELGLGNLNLDRLVDLLLVAASVVCVVLDGGGEERVDERRLSKTGLSCYLE